jgi:hypothetical protein
VVDHNDRRIIPFPRRDSPARRPFSPLPILDNWRIVESGSEPYLIEGTVAGRPVRETVLALTLEAGGLAGLRDRWVILGLPGSGGLAVIDEDAVLARAAAWIRAGRLS